MAHQLSCLSNLSSLSYLSEYQYPHGTPAAAISYKPKPSKYFQVKNSTSNNDSTDYRIERRKMVLGLGASNLLVSGAAFADDKITGPLKPPSFKSCGTPENAADGAPLPAGTKCCLPPSDKVIDYVLPAYTTLRMRRPAHKSTSTEDMRKYAQAVAKMKALPPEDPRSFTMQANVHCAYCNHVYHQDGTNKGLPIQVHFSWLFFPFHRWYLYFYERILGSLINDPTFALPYWNWDNPDGGMSMPSLFQDQGPVYGALYNPRRDQSNVNGDLINYTTFVKLDDDATRRNNCAGLSSQMITELCDVYDFMGQPYGQGSESSPKGQGSLEKNAHTNIHWLVGDPRSGKLHEDMGNFYSAGRDPVFYSHHSNVDRLWTIWSNIDAGYDKNIKSNDFREASLLFYNENSELCRVKVKDCLDHRKMGYDYEISDISCWYQFNRTAQNATSKDKVSAAKAKAPEAETVVFPLKLEDTVKLVVKKAVKGKANEILVLEDITLACDSFAKFDVFVNDEDDDGDFTSLDKAAYAGSFSYAPLGGGDSSSKINTFTRLRLTTLYDFMDVDGDETLFVTLVPRRTPGDQAVTIGAIKVIECK